MPSLQSSNKNSPITWLDLTIIVSLIMMWFLVNQVWTDHLAGIMFTVSVLMLSIFLIARFTGFLSWVKLTIPVWTLSGAISVLLWRIYLVIIPISDSGSTLAESISEGFLSQIFDHNTIVRLLQIWLFPVTESLLIIFFFALFVGVALRSKKNKSLASNRGATVAPLILSGSFGALMHIGVATKLKESGLVRFDISLIQQLISFLLFVFMGILLGAPAIIASHVVKNLWIYGNATWWIWTFIVFITLDAASIAVNGSQKIGNQNKTMFT